MLSPPKVGKVPAGKPAMAVVHQTGNTVILSERLIIICCFVAYVSVGPLMTGPFCLEMGVLEKVAEVPEHLLVSQKNLGW